ncbi:RNA methyltransferase [Candidatus Babeliales bacterium]|nr:RNA methyltransferase [Candidatus Babeliales bacterium]
MKKKYSNKAASKPIKRPSKFNKVTAKPVSGTSKPLDLVYGVHSVLEMLLAKRRKVTGVYTTETPIKAWSRIEKLIPSYIRPQTVGRDVLEKLSGSSEHQGIVVATTPFPFEKSLFEPAKFPFLVVLDGVQDVRNLGAIIRSAYCTGVDGIVLCGRNSAPLTPAAIKASAGLAEHARIFIAPSMSAALKDLQTKGYHLYLATLGEGENATQLEFKAPSALVIGNEETGVSKETLKFGTRVLLPQRRADISYNASVAAGILLFLMGVQLKKI